MNVRLLIRLLRRKPPPRDRAARRAFVEERRKEAFGEITDETRAADRQLLADAKAGKGELI